MGPKKPILKNLVSGQKWKSTCTIAVSLATENLASGRKWKSTHGQTHSNNSCPKAVELFECV